MRDILVQAFLDAPVFQTRWRWNATISLAVPRNRGGRKVPPQLQRMQADDLMAAVFPDAAACLENIPGDGEIPDHPLVNQTVRDCLEEAMDLPQPQRVLDAHPSAARCTCVSRDTPEPSAFCSRNPQRAAVRVPGRCAARGAADAGGADAACRRAAGGEIGALDAAAIERVRDEVRPDPRDADELHDALLTCGLPAGRGGRAARGSPQLAAHARARRRAVAARRWRSAHGLWVAAERLPELLAVHPDASRSMPPVDAAAVARRTSLDA